LLCDKNQYVTSLHVWSDHGGTVHHFRFTCHSFDRQEWSRQYTDNNGGVPSHSEGTACPIGEFAIGVRGTRRSLINRLGLICEEP
jgi:hypothetical protein